MNNIEKLKEYLVGSKGYLLNDKLSNGKVIMLSGAWGSGKTHFWDNEIREKLDKNIYVSLYGKKSILDIENEVLTKSILKELPDDNKIVENLSLFGSITKNIANIYSNALFAYGSSTRCYKDFCYLTTLNHNTSS